MQKVKRSPLSRLLEQRDKLNINMKKLEAQKSMTDKQLLVTEDKLMQIQDQIKTLQNDVLDVTDHAIVRYLERIMGMDMQMVKEAILSDELRKVHKTIGDGKYTIPIENEDNCTVVIQGGRVVTLYSADGQDW